MNFDEVRKLTIIALFSDDQLMEQLVLKGGNALSLVHGLSRRISLDLDFSIDRDFADFGDAKRRLFAAVKKRFDAAGYVVFSERFEPRPKLAGPDERPWWGGYELTFNLIEKAKYERLKNQPAKMQINALVTGPDQRRTFSVELSKCEYTEGKLEREIDHHTIYVYTLEMIAIEKLRAICQQMPEYRLRGQRTARARDFYDIHLVLSQTAIDLTSPANRALLRNIFAAKQVPLLLLGQIEKQREFHRPDWPAVQAAVPGSLEEFDFYFDFVIKHVNRLKALWEE